MNRPLLIALAVLSTPGVAAAGSGRDVAVRREAARRARLAYDSYVAGDYDRAVRLYEAAYKLAPTPTLLFNMALAWEKNFDYERCAIAVDRFLTESSAGLHEGAAHLREHCRAAARVPVKVSSWPPGAALYVDGAGERLMVGRTPQTLELAPGAYRLTAEMPGFRSDARAFEVAPGQRPAVDFALEKLSSLHIEADVSGAAVRIDAGRWEPAPVTRELPAGAYRVRLRRAGHRDVTRQVRVQPGEQLALVVALPALPRRQQLTVSATAGAHVVIDRGAAAPAPLRRRLAVGVHHLEVTAPGRIPFAEDIRLPEDGDLKLRVHLAPRRSRAQRVVFWGLLGAAAASLAAGTLVGAMALGDEAAYGRGASPDLRERGERRALAADALLVSAGALAVSAVAYRWLTRPGRSSMEPR